MPELETPAEPQVTFGVGTPPPSEPPPPEEKPRDSSGRFIDQATAKLHAMAREAGVPAEEIETSSPEELRNAIKTSKLEESIEARFKAMAPLPTAPAAPAPVSDAIEGEDDIAPQIVSVLKSLRSEIKALKEENANLERRRSVESFNSRVDKAFSELSENYPQLGKGAKDELDGDSDEMDLRGLVVRKAIRLAGKGATEAQILKKIKSAAEGLLGPKKKDEQPSGRFSAEEWNGAGIAHPSHRNDGLDEPPTRAKAESIVASYLARTGKR